MSDRTWPRWLLSAAVVLLAHGGVAAAIVHWQEAGDDAPASAIVIDLAPAMMAPEDKHEDIPPGPEQVQSEASPEQKVEKVEEEVEKKTETKVEQEPQPEIEQAPNPEVAMAPEPPKPQQQELPSEAQDAAPVTSAPQMPRVEEAPVAAAPVQAPLSVSNSNTIPTWTRKVVALLERNKRYPAAARARADRGTAQLVFSLDRQGKVTGARLTKSSGSAALDQEALDLVRRAQPFPPPPEAMPGPNVDLSVPVSFNVR
jgi:periplasmic protein TonB